MFPFYMTTIIKFLIVSFIFHSIFFILFYTLKFENKTGVRSVTVGIIRFFVNNRVSRMFLKGILITLGLSFFYGHHIVLAMESGDIGMDTSASILGSYSKTIAYYTGIGLCVTAITAISGWFLSNIWAAVDMGINVEPDIMKVILANPYPYEPTVANNIIHAYNLSHFKEIMITKDLGYAGDKITVYLEALGNIDPLRDANTIMSIISTYNTIDLHNMEHMMRLGYRIGNEFGSVLPGDINIKFTACTLIWEKYGSIDAFMCSDLFYDPEKLSLIYQQQKVKTLKAILDGL